MKRKKFRNVTLVLAGILFCGIAGSSVKLEPKAANEEFDPTFAVVNDFESFSDLYELSWYGSFGAATLNENSAYVTSGNKSIKLNPIGDYHVGENPTYVKIPLNRLKEYPASKMTSVSFEVFNASDKDGTVSCALAIDGTNTAYVDFAIKKDERKTISLEYDLVAMSAVYDINNVEGIYVKFPKALDRQTQDANIWYVDNFRATYTPFEPKGYEIALDENEFCSFDKIYQEYFVNTNCGVGAIDGYRPEVSINTDPYFCADRTSEDFVFGQNKSLKVVAKAGLSSGNPGFTFFDDLWHSYEWSEMNDKALQFEVYNASESPFSFSLSIFRNPDNAKTGYYDRYSKSFTIPAHSWQTVTLPIQEMNDSTKKKDEETNGLPMTSYIERGKVVYTYQIPKFIYNAAAVGTSDRTFYFDNFRFVNVSE